MYLPKSRGHISIEQRFVSIYQTKEALQSAFNVVIEQEDVRRLRGKIIRFARLYGFPVFWPSAGIEIWIDRDAEKLSYTFTWPDYYMLLLYVVLLPVLWFEANLTGLKLLIVLPVVLFHFFLIDLDRRYVQSRVRRFLLKTQGED